MDGIECIHEWKKALARSGMYFISVCKKCGSTEPYPMEDQLQDLMQKTIEWAWNNGYEIAYLPLSEKWLLYNKGTGFEIEEYSHAKIIEILALKKQKDEV